MDFYALLAKDPQSLSGACVVILGGGGKTGLLLRLGAELAGHHPRVLLTSLTKSEAHLQPPPLLLHGLGSVPPLPFDKTNPLMVMSSQIEAGKLLGISPQLLATLLARSSLALAECDGARKLPLKAHSMHDPAVPECATHIVVVVGASVVDTTIEQGLVHRPELFQSLWGVAPDFQLDVDFIAEVVTSSRGYRTKIPGNQPVSYFINQADRWPQPARRLARAIKARYDGPTFWGSLRDGELHRL